MHIEPALVGPVSLFLGALVGGSASLLGAIYPKSGSWVIAKMGRIGAFDGDEHNSFAAFTSP